MKAMFKLSLYRTLAFSLIELDLAGIVPRNIKSNQSENIEICTNHFQDDKIFLRVEINLSRLLTFFF